MSVANASGIITFPSLHAAGALLCAWAAWDIKIARYPFAIWNIIMATSAISHANHYLVDVIAGIAMAALSILIVKELLRFMQRKAWQVPSPSAISAMLVGTKSRENGSRNPA
jgi:membrane-associated phospholipid phosphatase